MYQYSSDFLSIYMYLYISQYFVRYSKNLHTGKFGLGFQKLFKGSSELQPVFWYVLVCFGSGS